MRFFLDFGLAAFASVMCSLHVAQGIRSERSSNCDCSLPIPCHRSLCSSTLSTCAVCPTDSVTMRRNSAALSSSIILLIIFAFIAIWMCARHRNARHSHHSVSANTHCNCLSSIASVLCALWSSTSSVASQTTKRRPSYTTRQGQFMLFHLSSYIFFQPFSLSLSLPLCNKYSS